MHHGSGSRAYLRRGSPPGTDREPARRDTSDSRRIADVHHRLAQSPIAHRHELPGRGTERANLHYAQLSRQNSDPESVAALVHGSVAIVQKLELTVDRGEADRAETTGSFQTSASRLMRLAASVQSSGGLDFDGVKFGYRTDSLFYQILSSISVLNDQRIPAYTKALASDPTNANSLKSAIVEARLGELTQGHPSAANDKLKRLVAEEIRIGSLEWIATRDLITLGLDHVTPKRRNPCQTSPSQSPTRKQRGPQNCIARLRKQA